MIGQDRRGKKYATNGKHNPTRCQRAHPRKHKSCQTATETPARTRLRPEQMVGMEQQ